jgi:HEAT repeat protein
VQATGNTLRGRRKAVFRYVQQGMNYILPAFVVFYIANKINPKSFFEAISTDFQITATTIAGASILALIYFSNRLDKFLRVMLSEGSKENTTRAILGLTMLRPRDFEVLISSILKNYPKKIVTKAAIKALSSVNSESAIRLILDQFHNAREEIQIAVIQAVRGIKNPFAINFLCRASTGNVGSIAMKARFEATEAISELYGASIVPMIMEGLKDRDARVVANTIDVLAQFYDARLVPTFFEFSNHPVPRIQANALLALRKYARSHRAWRSLIIDRFEKSDLTTQPSLLYVMGKSGDRGFCEYIKKISSSNGVSISSGIIERGVAIALISLFDKAGYDALFKILAKENLNRDVEDAIILFGGVDGEARIRTIEYLIAKHSRMPEKLHLMYSRLKASPLDLHFELELLKLALGPGVAQIIHEPENVKSIAA